MTETTREETIAQAAEAVGFDPAQLKRLAGADLSITMRPVRVRGRYAFQPFVTVDGRDVPLAQYAEGNWTADLPTLRPASEPSIGAGFLARKYGVPPQRSKE